jgi:chromodomain-helicase-DNA-binding protein 7
MNAVLYYDQGGAEGRNALRLYEWYYTDITSDGVQTQKHKIFKFNVILTSFEVFCSDLYNVFLNVPFRCLIVDEAHRLKNRAGKTLTLLKEHPCVRVFLLTGTPVQNNTKELFTLLNYIEPLRFRSMEILLEKFGDLKNADQVQALQTLLRPYFLRRLKEDVENSIPPLEETVVEVGLTKLQTVYYKGIYGENKYMLSKFGSNSAKTIHLNNMDIQLRKCCNHLYLLKGVEEELEGKCHTDQEYYQSLLDSSGKLILLDKFIQKFKDEGHKMLIFSQFKKMLEVIEIYLRIKSVPYEVLTGSVKSQDRVMSIQRFNDDPTFGVFLLTTRAGGLGINLTSARVVIIFDSDWNPQNDLQAIARAHRIGQIHEVKVYRLITSKTYEEQMFNRASKKLGMEQALFSKFSYFIIYRKFKGY